MIQVLIYMSSKGIAIPVIGLALVVVSVIFFFLFFSGTSTKEMTTILKGEVALSMGHDAELTRKMAVEGIEPSAVRATYDLGNEGGGFQLWGKNSPSLSELKRKLQDRISSTGISTIKKYNNKRVIDVGIADVQIDKYDSSPCGSVSGDYIHSTCFHIDGIRALTITDARIKGELDSGINLSKNINSGYFELLSIGRKLFENENYKIRKDKVVPNCIASLPPATGDYHQMQIDYLINNSLWCGYGDNAGLISLTDFSNQNAVNSVLNNILNSIKSDLESKYPSNINFDFKQTNVIQDNRIIVTVYYTLEDEDSKIPIRENERIALGLTQPLDDLKLKFISYSEYFKPPVS